MQTFRGGKVGLKFVGFFCIVIKSDPGSFKVHLRRPSSPEEVTVTCQVSASAHSPGSGATLEVGRSSACHLGKTNILAKGEVSRYCPGRETGRVWLYS